MTARVLSIAGSDPVGGAGVQTDLAAFRDAGAWGMTAITAVTVQDTRAVHAVHPLDPSLVVAQIDAVVADTGVRAAKTGLLPGVACVEAVAEAVRRHGLAPLVVDPVLSSTSGHALTEPGVADALRERLLPLATLVVPNAGEARRLTGIEAGDLDGQEAAAHALCEAGAGAALVTGGHIGGDTVTDVLVASGTTHRFTGPRLAGGPVRGTGCYLSAAIAARLEDAPVAEAVGAGIDAVRARIARAIEVGRGARVLG